MYKKLVGPYALTRRRKAILAVYQSRQKKSEGFGGEWRRTESKAELIGYIKVLETRYGQHPSRHRAQKEDELKGFQ